MCEHTITRVRGGEHFMEVRCLYPPRGSKESIQVSRLSTFTQRAISLAQVFHIFMSFTLNSTIIKYPLKYSQYKMLQSMRLYFSNIQYIHKNSYNDQIKLSMSFI